MKRTMFALMLAAGACSTAMAAVNDPYYMGLLDNPLIGTAPDPTLVGGDWVWNGYEAGLPADDFAWCANKWMYFGLENLWVDEFQIKTVTLEFDYIGVVNLTGTPERRGWGSGYDPANYTGGTITNLLEESRVQDGADPTKWHYKLVYTIDPQPDWEWVLLKNDWTGAVGAGCITISNVSLTSFCVPSPAAGTLLALGGLIVTRRRR